MNSHFYEEVCRRCLAQQFGLPVEAITSRLIENPQRPGDPEFAHQIDHYWETGPPAALYINIANSKWRSSSRDKVDQPDVLLLQQVRTDVRAHKALLLTSTEFTAGARAAAEQYGIGLHIVRPSFDHAGFPTHDRAAMQAALAQVKGELYTHQIVHRGLDFGALPEVNVPAPHSVSGHMTRQVTSYTTRAGPGLGSTNRGLGGPPSGPSGSPFGGGGRGGPGFTRGGGGGIVRR